MICPSCGSTSYRESRQCPAHGGTPVCISCCYSCEYLAEDRIICRYRIENPVRSVADEIAGLRRRAEHKKRQSQSLRRKGMHFAAYKVEEEWRMIWRDIRELEEELNETGT